MKNYRLSLVLPLFIMNLSADSSYKLSDIDIMESSFNMPQIMEEQFSDPFIEVASSSLSSETLSQKDIEAIKPKNIFDLINRAQGANISFMGRKHPYTISFRGSSSAIGSSSFGVILDGALLSDNSAMRVLETLPVEVIQSIKIVRDSSALSLAPLQAFGTPNGSPTQGFLVIKTKLPTKNEGGVKVSYESFDTKKANIYYGGMKNDIYYLASLNGVKSSGKNGYNNGVQSGSGFFKVGLLRDDYTIEFDGFYSRAFQEIQKANLSVSMFDSAYWKYEPFENRVFNLHLTKKWSQNQITSLTISHSKSNWKHDQDTNAPNDSLYFIGSQKNNSIDLKHSIKFDKHLLKAGFQGIHYDSPNGELFYEGYQRKEQIYGVFLQAEHFLSDKLIVDEAIRVDRKHIDKLLERYTPNVTATFAQNTWKVPLNNAKVSMIEDTWAKSTINGAIGATYKLNLNNLISAKFAYASNSAIDNLKDSDGFGLDKEEQFKYEFSYELAMSNITSKVNLFYYDIKNLKFPSYQGTPTDPEIIFSQYDQERYGGEFSLNGKVDSFDYLFNYAYVKADIKDNEIPNHVASLQLGYGFDKFKAYVTSKYVSEYESNFFTKDYKYHKVGDFAIVDLSIDYYHKLFNYDAKATIFGKNITDKRYMTKIGWEDVGAIVGVSYSFTF